MWMLYCVTPALVGLLLFVVYGLFYSLYLVGQQVPEPIPRKTVRGIRRDHSGLISSIILPIPLIVYS